MRLVCLLLASAALAACQQSSTASNDASVVGNAATATASVTENTPAAAAAGCAAGMKSEVDKDSFGAAGEPPSAQQFEALRAKADLLFRDVANRMCAANELKPDEIGLFRRLLIQNGGGADNTAIYSDPEQGSDTLIFQYTFEGEVLGVPGAEDVREGLLCNFGDEEKYREMCELRRP